jgi:hypothetical protein
MMLHKMRAPCEGLVAVSTLIGLLSYVSTQMPDELSALNEGLVAFIGFLSSVCPLMCNKVRTLAEGIPTVSTLIGFLSSMNSLTNNKVRVPPE